MNAAFSEYILYEPALRILTARHLVVQSEVACPGFPRQTAGDKKRLDFVATGNGVHFALELKWVRETKPRITGDVEKLQRFLDANPNAAAFLCVFGRKSDVVCSPAQIGFPEHGCAVYAEFGVTKFGCRMFEIGGDYYNSALQPIRTAFS